MNRAGSRSVDIRWDLRDGGVTIGGELVIESNPAARVTENGKGYIEVAALKITTKRKEAGLKLRRLSFRQAHPELG